MFTSTLNNLNLKEGRRLEAILYEEVWGNETAGIQVDIRIKTSDTITYLHMLILTSIRTP